MLVHYMIETERSRRCHPGQSIIPPIVSSVSGRSGAPLPNCATACATAAFRPKKLKSQPACPSIGRGRAKRRRPPSAASRRAWLAGLSLNVNGAGARLQHLVYDPEMAALLAASPRLVALLRPLCRMLAVEFPHGILPPRPPRGGPRPRCRRRHPPRRGDLLFLLRMGKPRPET